MAALAPSLSSMSLSDSALLRPPPSLPLLRALRVGPSLSLYGRQLSLSISLQRRTLPFQLTPLVAQTSSEAEAEAEAEEQQLESDGELLSGGEEAQEEEEYTEPPEEAKLFVGGIPFDVTSEKLAEIFDGAGTVEVAEIIYNRDTDQSRGFGFVTMSTVEEADKAIEMFDRYEINGRLLKVNRAAPRGTRVERQPRESRPQFSIYVGNLSWGVDEARLEQIFSEYGKVVSSRVMYDRESGRSRGFGFVAMETKEEMNDAIAALDGEDLDGRALRVNIAEDRRRPSAF